MSKSSEISVRVRPQANGGRMVWVEAILPRTWTACVTVLGDIAIDERMTMVWSTGGRQMRPGKKRSYIAALAAEKALAAVRKLEAMKL